MDYYTAYLFYQTWGYWPASYIPQYYPLPLVEWPYRWEHRFGW